MNECVTSRELEICYTMVVCLMGDCADKKWLQGKENLKQRKMKLASENVVREVLTKAVDDGQIDALLGNFKKMEAGSNAGSKAGDKKAKKSATPKLTKATFSYRYLSECQNRLMLLFQGLLKAELIDGDTKPDDFLALFEGKPSDVKIKWKGSLASLWYLFKVMLEKGYVVKPEGVGQWIVVQSHFVDAKSKMFADFNKQKPPLKLKEVLGMLAELLNPNFEHELHG